MNPSSDEVASSIAAAQLHRDEQRGIALGHVDDVRVARGHARIGVAQEFLHGAQIAGVQVAQGGGGVAQRVVRDARALQAGESADTCRCACGWCGGSDGRSPP